ncbi:MAG: bifunctional diaminohydroxyphosphoribosylaminopyrimidine deaminase/5-amino-6-(5-phosphoribosylamino)uracil reductase RibD, partial [Nevskiales bacterium]
YTTRPNPRVGCVLVANNQLVAEGWHERAGGPHAEVVALNKAGDAARGATAYVSLEPCCHHGRTAPCSQALIDAGVARVVMAMQDPNPQVAGQGRAQLEAAGIEVGSGVLQSEAEELNRGFSKRMRHGRPWVSVKLAMTLDGRTAAADGSSQWITGSPAREDVHRLRARAGAVLTGIGTVLADNPRLDVRLEQAADWPPVQRFVLDSQLRMPADAAMLQLPGRTVILAGQQARGAEVLQAAGAEVQFMPLNEAGQVELEAVLDWLAGQQVNELLVEAGAELAGGFIQAGLADELVIYMAPSLLGSAGRGLLTLPALQSIEQQMHLDILDMRKLGEDWRITATIKK